ncbi:hypothetical protein AAFF_G00030260 [Aldrovandia affinis]|uniref:Uncharacterized protein n=1 Tax=Aldrovandia affinis TaxID=143900 RepID=A0AAD7S3Y1_9TELE|nr:hypothetical protein AAFF_G00030260 [Aldrovandia affinis]
MFLIGRWGDHYEWVSRLETRRSSFTRADAAVHRTSAERNLAVGFAVRASGRGLGSPDFERPRAGWGGSVALKPRFTVVQRLRWGNAGRRFIQWRHGAVRAMTRRAS